MRVLGPSLLSSKQKLQFFLQELPNFNLQWLPSAFLALPFIGLCFLWGHWFWALALLLWLPYAEHWPRGLQSLIWAFFCWQGWQVDNWILCGLSASCLLFCGPRPPWRRFSLPWVVALCIWFPPLTLAAWAWLQNRLQA